ncbi:hypothetical protein [Gottfriedia solisilvae]|uniref:hypothetical protein n=1 Tax=Gottfriedia solisilvae TaxID=1516104 RepID=UPI003D2F4DC6
MNSLLNEQLPFTFEDFRSIADAEFLHQSNRSDEFESLKDGFDFIKENSDSEVINEEALSIAYALADALDSTMKAAIGDSQSENFNHSQPTFIDYKFNDDNLFEIEVAVRIVYDINNKSIVLSEEIILTHEYYINDDYMKKFIEDIQKKIHRKFQAKLRMIKENTKDEILNHIQTIYKAMNEIVTIHDTKLTEEQINTFATDYPFAESLDELACSVFNWYESLNEQL